MIEKIVSGGQTGVDQAGLSIGDELKIPISGWCPKGGLDENGDCVLDRYPSLTEATTANPDERTMLNIRDSDGTLIIVPCLPLPEKIQDGTRLTIADAERQRKPHLIISLTEKDGIVEKIHEWISRENIHVLNIAGPRESNSPGIHIEARTLFRELFVELKSALRI